MSVEELLKEARMLPRRDQLQLATALRNEYSASDMEILKLFENVREIPMDSPVEAYEAAACLMNLLSQNERESSSF